MTPFTIYNLYYNEEFINHEVLNEK
ncbi:YoaP domain-containing protein [Romboutsia sp. 1001216sp1]